MVPLSMTLSDWSEVTQGHCKWYRDKWRFPSKIPIFPPRVFNAVAAGVPLGIGYRRKGSKKLKWWGYQMVENVLR